MVLLFDCTSTDDYVKQAWKQLFIKKGRAIDGPPPTQASFIQHIKLASYQTGHCWAQIMIAAPELPSPSEWGWNRRLIVDAVYAGRPYQKRRKLAGNSCDVAASRDAEGAANARRQVFSAHIFVTAMECALSDTDIKLNDKLTVWT